MSLTMNNSSNLFSTRTSVVQHGRRKGTIACKAITPQTGTPPPSRLSSNIAHTRRYRTSAPTSQVDEILFKTAKQSACEVQNLAKGGSRTQLHSTEARNPGTIRIITKDFIRELRIPNKDPSEKSIIFCPAEFESILRRSRVLTKEEREEELETQHKAWEEARNAAQERKVLMQQADLSRLKNQAQSELEAEAKERAQYLLERADTLKMEQEDEIKTLNNLIRGAHCHTERDAQIQEKKRILSERQEEERRLDAMMEADRRRALETQKQTDELRKNQRIQGKMCILKQINEHQQECMQQEVLKEQEGKQMLEKLKRMQVEEMEAMEKSKAEQRRLQLEILKINEESLHAKERRKEEQRQAELRAQEYTRQKLAREAEYEAEQKRIKKEKERKGARLRALHEKDRDYKAEQDALRARRNQEAAEREWRRKEKEQAKKMQEEEERLKAARLEQIHHRERMMLNEAGRERAEFERVLKFQQKLITQDKEKEERCRQQILHHTEDLLQQIREREARADARRREKIREREKLDEEVRIRRTRVDEVKEKKLKELKGAGLPKKYYSQVERKMHFLPLLVC